jgi:hypothetical protein
MCGESAWEVLAQPDRTWRTFGLAFCMLARAGAGIVQMLRARHRGYPFKLFSLLRSNPQEAATNILNDATCMRDSFSNGFLADVAKAAKQDADAAGETADPSVEDLCGNRSRMSLLTVALTIKTDTARIECRHAAVRRTLLTSMTHTHPAGVASAGFVLVRQRVLLHQGRVGKKPASKVKKSVKKAKGGGGTFRCFLSRFLKGKPLPVKDRKQVFQDAADQYKELTVDQKAELQPDGRIATLAHAAGGHAFGPPPSTFVRRGKQHKLHSDDLYVQFPGLHCKWRGKTTVHFV